MNTPASWRSAGSARTERRSNFEAVSVGHLAIDIFNSMGPVILAHLRLTMGLSTAQVGLAVGIYQLLAGATQPLFGWLVDRGGSRRLGPASVAWVIVLVATSAVMAPRIGYVPFLVLFALAAVGSGAFHPQGTMHAGLALSGKASTTTAIFFFFGQVGLSLGPLLAGLLIDRVGLGGIGGLALLLIPVPIWMALRMGGSSRQGHVKVGSHLATDTQDAIAATLADAPATINEALALEGEEPEPDDNQDEAALIGASTSTLIVSLLAAVFALRAWIFIGTAAFLPLLFQAAGASATRQGLLTGAFWLGGGFSGVAAGFVADRLGKRVVAAVSTALGGALLLWLPLAQGALALPVVLLCGAFLGAPHSLLMVLAQELLPVRRGLASGYALGFLFSMGALASWGIGLLAEFWPLATIIQVGVVPGLLAAILLLLLPSGTSHPPRLAQS